MHISWLLAFWRRAGKSCCAISWWAAQLSGSGLSIALYFHSAMCRPRHAACALNVAAETAVTNYAAAASASVLRRPFCSPPRRRGVFLAFSAPGCTGRRSLSAHAGAWTGGLRHTASPWRVPLRADRPNGRPAEYRRCLDEWLTLCRHSRSLL